MTIVKVGIADMKVASKDSIIRTSGLGSCIGVTLYDKKMKIGGMLHFMLPESPSNKSYFKRAKYADTGIYDLVDEMVKEGCTKKNLVCKMAGGAQMFKFSGGSELLKIGHRNAEAAEQILKNLHIDISVRDVGGDYGRTIDLDCDSGKLHIKTVSRGAKEV